ncbi:MAG: glycosyltransferase family 4 protein [Patescibacteria group bacterium]
MRICVLIDAWDPVWGGGQTHVWEIANRLVRKGWQIDIFTRALSEGNITRKESIEILTKDKLRVIRVGRVSEFNNVPSRLIWLIKVVIHVWKYHQKKPYDLIHAHAFLPAIPGKMLQILINRPLVYTVHGSPLMDVSPNSIGAWIERILLTGIKFDREISVGERFLKYPNLNRNIAIIPNGVNLELFKATTRQRMHSNISILWVGRFDKIKGIPILLTAFAKVIRNNQKLKLKLVGFGLEKKTYEHLAHKLNLTKSVEFVGKKTLKQLALIYRTADLFILPSLSEGQPVTLFEAMASCIPVIATDVGDNAKFVKEGTNGWLVKPGNIENLAQVLKSACSSKKLKIMGQKGRQLMESHFSWNKSVHETEKLYLSLL